MAFPREIVEFVPAMAAEVAMEMMQKEEFARGFSFAESSEGVTLCMVMLIMPQTEMENFFEAKEIGSTSTQRLKN